MAEKALKTRIQLKNDTETNWGKATNFIPKQGEIIIYNDSTSPRIKVGDGVTTVTNLPFITGDAITVNGHTVEKNVPANAVFTDTTYIAGTGISLTGTTINNSGVRSITTGSADGTISVNTNGTSANVTIKGLKSAAYTDSTNYATAAQGALAVNAMPKSGGTFTGNVTLNSDPTTNLMAATKQYVDNNVNIEGTLGTGTQIGILTINGTPTTIYTPNAAPMTVQINPSSSTPTAEFILSTNTSSSSELTGILGSTSPISDGQIIYYLTRYELLATDTTLRLSYSNSNTDTGAIPIYSYGDVKSHVKYPANYVLTLIYYNNAFYVASSNLAVVK